MGSKLNISDRPKRAKEELPYECRILTDFKELLRMLMMVKRAQQCDFLKGYFTKKSDSSSS